MDAFMVKVEEIKSIFAPSGSACATKSAPMEPPAPGLFSMNTLRLSRALNCWAMLRPTMSLLPPGAKGTMILMAFGEPSCANDAPKVNKEINTHLKGFKK